MAKFVKGQPRVEGAGRKPGSINKTSLLVRDILESNNIDLVKQILARIPELPSKQAQLDALMKLMPYVYPQLSAIAIQNLNPDDEMRKLKDLTNDALDAILIAKSE